MNLKKLLIYLLVLSCFMFHASCFFFALASDYIIPNSGSEPIVVDISSLNLTTGLDVNVGEFTDQPRSYRDSNTNSIVIFPPAASDSERTIQINSGSTTITKTVSFRSSPDGNLKNSSLPDLQDARGGNTATKISDGRVILIGGSKGLADGAISSLEAFNPETGKSESLKTPDNTKKAKLQIPRSQHTSTYIGISNVPLGMISGPVEQIVVVGGFSSNGALDGTIEIVEINVGSNQAVSTLLTAKKAKLKKARIYHTANLLPDGRLLIVGGQGRISKTALGALNSVEIFDPVSRAVQASSFSLNTARLLHTATTLQDGNILIAGGFTNEGSGKFGLGPATDIAELVDTKNFTISKTGLMKNATGGHTATLLTNGQILITGGSSALFVGVKDDITQGLSLSNVQFYDNSNQTFNLATNESTGGNLELQTARFLHKTVLLPNGDLAIIGGLNIKQGSNTENFISTPVSKIEVVSPNLPVSGSGVLKISQKSVLDTFTGRVLPTVVLVTPKNKTQGLVSSSDINKFVNCGVYLTGGFTNGSGRLPSKISEFLQIESNTGIEGRQIVLNPEAVIQGSYFSQFLVELDKFSKLPSLKVEPQSINLSSSNNFLAVTKVLSTGGQIVLLKAQSSDPNGSIIVSPSLFQSGENITITRKDSSVQGLFKVTVTPVESTSNYVPAEININVSDSAKPILATVPGYGVSLSTQAEQNSDMVQVKVLSQDGSTVLSSVPTNTEVTATIKDPTVANLGGTGILSVTGNLLTQFIINAIKPGKTDIDFSINFPDVLPVSIPLQISGAPTFSNSPIDASTVSSLALNSGVQLSGVTTLSPFSISLDDFILSSDTPLFPIYVPINLQSSVDSSVSTGLFTIRPVFGIDLLTSIPRTFVNKDQTEFKTPLTSEPNAIGGFVSSDTDVDPISILASDDGIRTISFKGDNSNLTGALTMLSNASGVKELKLFEFGTSNVQTKIALLKGAMVSLIDSVSGDEETSANLTGEGFELVLTRINGQTAAVVSVGSNGIDLVFPVTDAEPRVENSRVVTNVKHITVAEKLGSKTGPFVVGYDDARTISIRNLVNLNDPVQTIDVSGKRFSKIAYAGKFPVNNKITDVLICVSERSVYLYDLNNLISIPLSENPEIKNKIEDLIVIDGTAYLALGESGILALSVGGLINNNKDAVITTFTKNKLTVVKSSGKETFVTKPLNVNKLAEARPFLLASGPGNNLTVIRVSP